MIPLLRKEFLEILRDRRTLFNTFVIPLVFFPAMMMFVGWIGKKGQEAFEERAYAVGIVGQADTLLLRMIQEERLQPVSLEAVPDSLPEEFKAFLQVKPGTLRVYYDGADEISRAVWRRLTRALERLKHQRVVAWLQDLGMDTTWLFPFQVETVNLATEERMAASALAQMLGYMMVLFIFVGGMNAALDTTAGEKERRTLEVLLALVPRRRDVVLAKVLAVAVMAFLTAPLMVLGMLLGMAQAGAGAFLLGQNLHIPWSALVLMVVLSMPFAVFTASLEVALGSFARGFREAQTYTAPILMIAVFPILLASLPFFTFSGWKVLVPVYNIGACFNELLREGVVWSHYLGTFASNLVYAALMVGVTLYLFRQEQVLFRE